MNQYVHNLSPFLISFSEGVGIRWYGLSYLAGFFVSYLIVVWFVKRQKHDLQAKQISDLVTYGAVGTLVGGRLGYVLFYSPDLIWKFKGEFPYWGLLSLNEGGMASHGGILGIVLALIIYSIQHNVHRLYLFDLAAVSTPIGIFFGRIANFINGELVGRPCPPDFAYGVKFPQDILQWPQYEPQKVSQLTTLVHQFMSQSAQKWESSVDHFQTQNEAWRTIYQIMEQMIHQIQTGNEGLRQAIAPYLEYRYPSQLYAALGEGLFLFIYLFFLWRSPRKPGVVGANFILLYSIVRIIDEYFRMPDAHLGLQLFDLTRGQWLSVGLFALGLTLLLLWSQRAALKIPGWSLGKNIRLNRR